MFFYDKILSKMSKKLCGEINAYKRSSLLADNSLLEKDIASLKSKIEVMEVKLLYTERLLAVYEKFEK